MSAPMSSTLGPAVPPAGGSQGGALLWSSRHVADAVGVTYRQLDYWCRTGRLEPTGANNAGPRRFVDADFEAAAALRDLFALGCRERTTIDAISAVRQQRVAAGEWLIVTIAGHALRCCAADLPHIVHRDGAPHAAWLVPLQAFDQGRPR